MTNLKAWCESKWEGPLLNGGHGNVFTQEGGRIRVRGGAERNYKSKEQKAYEARFGLYNKKLVPVILAQATRDDRFGLPRYSWPAHVKSAPVESVPRKQRDGEAGSRRRISRVKLAQAQAILSKVPQDELASFLARFGLSMSLAASIASLDNVEQIARQFLRATL